MSDWDQYDSDSKDSDHGAIKTAVNDKNHPMPYSCPDNWVWNLKDKSTEVRVYHSTTAFFHPNWSSGTAAIRGTKVLNNSKVYWEIALSNRVFGTSIMFGIGTKKARLDDDTFCNLIGSDSQSWGLSHKGTLIHRGTRIPFTAPFKENRSTVIGLLFDGIEGTLSYYKDGRHLGVAFRGLHTIKDPLYPMISSTAAKTEMTLQNARRYFVNLQDRCRATILQRMFKFDGKDSADELDKLPLPKFVKQFLNEGMISYKPEEAQSYKILDF